MIYNTTMDITEQINRFQKFFEDIYKEKIITSFMEGKKYFEINFNDLVLADMELTEQFLNEPEDIFRVMEAALEHFDIPENLRPFKPRLVKLPTEYIRDVWEIRNEDIGKFIAIKGIISKFSNIIHDCQSAKFECKSCGLKITILMKDGKFKEPSKCTCGGRNFIRMKPTMIDLMRVGITDDLMDEDNKNRSVARTKIAILAGTLTSREAESLIATGRKVILNGYFEYKQKGNTTEFESVFMVNSIEYIEVGWHAVELTKSEVNHIEELAKQPDIICRLAQSVADIKGYDEAKKACLLQLAGSPHIYDKNGVLASRGTIHVLLIGNPSTAKTYMAKRFGRINPIYSFQSASTASGKGLVAAVQNDPEMGCATLYPGVVAMANRGVVVIDEIDKTNEDDYGDHNNAMEDMEVIVAKSNVKARLETKTSYLATANPESRVFIQEIPFFKQINMPADFQDRFDIIFPMFSPTDKDKMESIMDIMLDRHLEDGEKQLWQPEFDHEFIQKYIAHCIKTKERPKMSKELFPFIKEKVHELMKPKNEEQEKITFRNINSITRFAYASARLHLRDVTKDDLLIAFELKRRSFIDLKIIDEHGVTDWGMIEHIVPDQPSLTEKVHRLRSLIREMTNNFVDGKIPWVNLVEAAQKAGISEDETDELFEKLKRNGDVYEPVYGFIAEVKG